MNTGGMLTIDTAGSPGVTPVLTTGSDTSACTRTVAREDQTSVRISRSADGTNPASVCAAAGSLSVRVTAGTNGSLTPPAVTWTQDPT